MNLLALIECPQHVCYRYRIEAYAPTLAERGHRLQTLSFREGGPARLRLFRAAAAADVVILQRKLLPGWQMALLRRLSKRLVYDLDDAVFQRDSFQPKGPASRRRARRFLATLQAADAVIVGNSYLARYARRIVGAEKIHLVPTTVQPRGYRLAEHRRSAWGVRLAWIGSSSTLQGLEWARRHLELVAKKTAGLELHLICDRKIGIPGLEVVLHSWSVATEAEDLARADIGISWLANDSWSRGKCGLKVLQYMAAGLPVVANPVGMNRRMIVHGETGFLADTPEEWAEAIARLASDPGLRLRMGAGGRRWVENRYSADQWAPRFADLVEGTTRERVVKAGSTTPFASDLSRHGHRHVPCIGATISTPCGTASHH